MASGRTPLTAARWPDLEALFGPHGAVGGCWCMTPRLPRADYELQKGEGNRMAFRDLVTSGEAHGILAYDDGNPAGWCAVGPREEFPALERSRIMRRVDDEPVWSIVCFFIGKEYRRQGLMGRLLSGAIAYAADHGATIVEGYPVEPRTAAMPPVFAWTGLASAFRQAGFVEVARRSETRPIMRYHLPTR